MLRLYWETVRHLRPIQVTGRIRYRLFVPKPDLRPAPALRPAVRQWEVAPWRTPEVIDKVTFEFLNERRTLRFPADWNTADASALWLYNLHYFNDLTAVGWEERSELHRELIERWLADNPPGFGAGWQPYPLSLRLCNWIKWGLAGNRLSAQATHSLAVQARFLRRRLEVHLLGNHLFENAKALIFAGLFFKGDEAEGWLRKGLDVLMTELVEQVLADGGHFELSPMYHALILDGLLDLWQIHAVFGSAAQLDLEVPIRKMLGWLRTMSHPDGGISFFNDATFGVAPCFATLEKRALTLGLGVDEGRRGSILLEASGYARLETSDAVILADVARIGPDYLPGHAHADTLSFEMSLRGRRVIVNSGVSQYGVGPERLAQRGSAAHNTVVLSGENSSEVWSGFRVARRARPELHAFRDGPEPELVASHDGYERLRGRPRHQRSWRLSEWHFELTDRLNGSGMQKIDLYFHFHPNFTVDLITPNEVCIGDGAGCNLTMTVDTGLIWTVRSGTWHPAFGTALPNFVLHGSGVSELPALLETQLRWNPA